MNANGDAATYDCHRCDSEHPLDELVGHLEREHTWSWLDGRTDEANGTPIILPPTPHRVRSRA